MTPIDGLAALLPQQRYERVPALLFEHVRRARVVAFPAVEVLHRVVHLAPCGEHHAAHPLGILDGVVGGDRGAERDRDDHRPLHAEVIDQVRQIAGLVDERKAIVDRACPRVPAPVVGEAAMIAREFRDLVFPVLEAVDLAVDEDEVGTLAPELVVEVAAIRVDGRHDIGLAGQRGCAADYRARRSACQRGRRCVTATRSAPNARTGRSVQ